jgi:hypothetical protein
MKHIFYGQNIIEKYALAYGYCVIEDEESLRNLISNKNNYGCIFQKKMDRIENTPIICETELIDQPLTPEYEYIKIGNEKLRIIEVFPDETGIIHCYTDKVVTRLKDEESFNKMIRLHNIYNDLIYSEGSDTSAIINDIVIPVVETDKTHKPLLDRLLEGLQTWVEKITNH